MYSIGRGIYNVVWKSFKDDPALYSSAVLATNSNRQPEINLPNVYARFDFLRRDVKEIFLNHGIVHYVVICYDYKHERFFIAIEDDMVEMMSLAYTGNIIKLVSYEKLEATRNFLCTI